MVTVRAVFTLLAGFVCVEGLKLEAGQLKVEQESEAEWEEISHQWVIRLTCGSFTFQGHPPLNVTWTTPSGQARFSSGYESGRFFLNLNAPVQGGKYTCAIPSHHLPQLCEEDGEIPDNANVSSSVMVDAVKARLTLVEANQKTLQKMMDAAEQRHEQDIGNLTQLNHGIQLSVQEQREALENLKEELEGLESEDVELSGPCREGAYNVLDDNWRSTEKELYSYEYDYYSEDGDSIKCDSDLEPGWYRFYLHGENAVMPTHCVEERHCQTHAPLWLDLQDQNLPEAGQEVESRACANWDNDCCMWESPVTVRNCGNFFVYHLEPRDTCSLAYCSQPQE